MASPKHTLAVTAARSRPIRLQTAPGYTDRTADRLRAYLASVRPLRGVAGIAESDEYQRGRALIESMALAAGRADEWPSLRLSVAQCADVLHFVYESEPVNARAWWSDPTEAPSHVCGYLMALGCVEGSLRRVGGRQS